MRVSKRASIHPALYLTIRLGGKYKIGQVEEYSEKSCLGPAYP